MQIHGLIHTLPKELKCLILAFVTTLSIGFYGGLSLVNHTTSMKPKGVEVNYLGNENDDNAVTMKFKKSEHELLSIIHNHILSMSVIFFLLSLVLVTTSINKKVKYILMTEPFISIVLTFGGIYILWSGVLWFKYVILISGILMTLSFTLAIIIIVQQLFVKKKYLKTNL